MPIFGVVEKRGNSTLVLLMSFWAKEGKS